MNLRGNPQYDRMIEAFRALYGPEMTDDERRLHECAVAKRKHLDELDRHPSDQLELDCE